VATTAADFKFGMAMVSLYSLLGNTSKAFSWSIWMGRVVE